MKFPTYRTIPFRVLRPALKLLPTIVTGIVSQVYTKEWEHQALARKIVVLKEHTDALKNPTRDAVISHLTAWYGVAHDLRDAIQTDKPELASILDNAIKDTDWLQVAWEYMQAQMETWKAAQN